MKGIVHSQHIKTIKRLQHLALARKGTDHAIVQDIRKLEKAYAVYKEQMDLLSKQISTYNHTVQTTIKKLKQ
ncbi:hypothetical protein [Niabella beijingensis]|uniref:hypothetical protein n=1 Tax=Niabella beijingensis TaxID=2872700 RepID=UPI001CBE9453|nr:hypothetical protein [Niabella beijingensis]MBZ4188004.1 hypothetical protein [Niabella beijingensis]